MPTTPPAISAWQTPPTRNDPANFRARADAWNADLPTKSAQLQAVTSNAYANAVEADADATATAASAAAALVSQVAAAASASLAASGAGASLWVSGTTYAINDVRRSPTTSYAYRRLTAGAGTTDPSADTTNWALAGVALPQLVLVSASTVACQSNGHYVLQNASVSTATLPASPSAGDVIYVSVDNGRSDNLIARNGNKIAALSEDLTLSYSGETVQLRYESATQGWRLLNV